MTSRVAAVGKIWRRHPQLLMAYPSNRLPRKWGRHHIPKEKESWKENISYWGFARLTSAETPLFSFLKHAQLWMISGRPTEVGYSLSWEAGGADATVVPGFQELERSQVKLHMWVGVCCPLHWAVFFFPLFSFHPGSDNERGLGPSKCFGYRKKRAGLFFSI